MNSVGRRLRIVYFIQSAKIAYQALIVYNLHVAKKTLFHSFTVSKLTQSDERQLPSLFIYAELDSLMVRRAVALSIAFLMYILPFQMLGTLNLGFVEHLYSLARCS
jgi:hypothetical protein